MKKVVITGANSGIGLALSRFLVQAGWHVLGCMRETTTRNASLIEELKQNAEDQPGGFSAFELEVTSETSQIGLARTLTEKFGNIDALIKRRY